MPLQLPVVFIGVPSLPPYERNLVVHKRWGVVGAQIIRSVASTRKFSIDCTITNHETEEDFWQAIVIMDRIQEEAENASLWLRGIEYPQCTFLGFEPDRTPFFDGSGQHGWTQTGKVSFLQIRKKDDPQQQGGQP